MRTCILIAALLASVASCHAQGLFVSWNRFAPRILAPCENAYAMPTNVAIWHLDAALSITNSTGLAPSNGDAITNWSDATSGQKFTQFDTASQPVYNATGTNGHPAVTFANSPSGPPSDFLTNYSGTTYNQGSTVFFVCTATTPPASAYGQEILDSGSSGRAIMQINNANQHLQLYSGSTLDGAAVLSGAGTTPWFVWTGQFNGGSSLMRTNGAAYASGAGGADPFIGFTLGCANGGFVGNGWSGNIAEGIFINATLTADEMKAWENYLGGKYCIPIAP